MASVLVVVNRNANALQCEGVVKQRTKTGLFEDNEVCNIITTGKSVLNWVKIILHIFLGGSPESQQYLYTGTSQQTLKPVDPPVRKSDPRGMRHVKSAFMLCNISIVFPLLTGWIVMQGTFGAHLVLRITQFGA
jgi:hypothetical protein